MTTTISMPDIATPAYRHAYSRIHGVMVVCEGLADRHVRLLAKAIPEDGPELERFAGECRDLPQRRRASRSRLV